MTGTINGPVPECPRTYVLVHGAFHGGWCWRRVQMRLEQRGHRVFAPSQTGLGDRHHLLSRDITMETFVADVVNLIMSEELQDVILVGHSFGARTVVGVADQIPDRLHHLVFLDGGFPVSGRSRLEEMPVDVREARIVAAERFSGGISVPPPPAKAFGLSNPADIAWVERHLTPHPLSVDAAPQWLDHEIGNGLPCTYVRFTGPTFERVGPSADYAREHEHHGWRYLELPGGHDAIIANPEPVSDVLLQVGHRNSRPVARPPAS